MIVKGRGKFVGQIIQSVDDGPTIIRIEDERNDEFWLEIELTQKERDQLNPFLRECLEYEYGGKCEPTKETTGDK